MTKLNYKLYKTLPILIISMFIVHFSALMAMAGQVSMEKIQIQHNPLSIKFFVNKIVPVKVIQIEKKELLVALKNVQLAKNFKIVGKKDSPFQKIAIEKLQGSVIAVIITSQLPYGKIRSGFNKQDANFTVYLEKKIKKKESRPQLTATPVKNPKKEIVKKKVTLPPEKLEKPPFEKEKKQAEIKHSQPLAPARSNDKKIIKKPVNKVTPHVYAPPVREQSKYKGDLSDISRMIDGSGCDSKQIANSVLLLKKNLYKKAFDILDQYIFQENFNCLESAYYLRAYAFYKQVGKDDFVQLMKAQQMFQDALVSYPKSSFLPYGYSAIGMIQKRLNNMSAAMGYFNIVRQGYLEYSGLPEIMYHLADIYDQKGYPDKALRYYKHVFEDTVENSYIADAGIGYGKGLYKKRQYLDCLAVLNYVVQIHPKKVYSSPLLLRYIGNADFEVGFSQAARLNLTRLMNIFPDINDRDVILSKIGDTYGMENNREKAVKIYELVRAKFPDSEGFIESSMGIARYLKTDKEKIEIYGMIKKKFPENKFARISMMRLAEIYLSAGEYNKCIKEVEQLLSTHPRGLRYEAVKLMQKAYEALFKKQLNKDEYTKVLNRYELEHERLDRMGSRKIAFSVGLAYLKAKLYEESFNHLIDAYKQYKRSSRSPQLLFGLGVAMDESGRDNDALKLFNAFSRRFPKNKHRRESLLRAGNIYLEKKQYKLSSARFNKAFKNSKTHLEKGNILIMLSNVYSKKGDMKTASKVREKAIKEIALAPGENYELLTSVYKDLGQTYIELKQYIKAADAYLKALSFSKDDREKANLGFLLGDAYQKGNIIQKAKEAFKQVVESYDSVWARLAGQRLNTFELAKTVQSS